MNRIKVYSAAAIMCALIATVIGFSILAAGSMRTGTNEKTGDDYFVSAQNYAEDGEYQKAIISYQKALEFGENISLWRGIAEAYTALEYYEEAEDAFRTVTASQEAVEEDFLGLIDIELKLNKLNEAKELTEALNSEAPSEHVTELYQQMNVEAPRFTYESGSYDEYLLLQLADLSYEGNVYYTLDGTEPTKDSPIFIDGIVISEPETHVRARTISHLGYGSEILDLDFMITKTVEEVSFGYDQTFSQLCSNILKKGWGEPVFNYELAQIRSVYFVGEWYCGTEPVEADFYADYYQRYNIAETQRGNVNLHIFSYMPFLKTLAVCYQEQLSLEELSELAYLEELSLLNDRIEHIEALSSLTHLKRLALGWNRIVDISPLQGLKELESLGLWNNQITDITYLSDLEHLYYFDIAHNQVSDIQAMSGLTELAEVWINDNAIADISPLDGCSRLNVVHYSDNPINEYGRWADASKITEE